MVTKHIISIKGVSPSQTMACFYQVTAYMKLSKMCFSDKVYILRNGSNLRHEVNERVVIIQSPDLDCNCVRFLISLRNITVELYTVF